MSRVLSCVGFCVRLCSKSHSNVLFILSMTIEYVVRSNCIICGFCVREKCLNVYIEISKNFFRMCRFVYVCMCVSMCRMCRMCQPVLAYVGLYERPHFTN